MLNTASRDTASMLPAVVRLSYVRDWRVVRRELRKSNDLGRGAIGRSSVSASKKAVARKAARAAVKPPALQQVEDQLQCVIDLAADFYWEQDAELRFTFYRPRAEPDEDLRDIIGKTSEELSSPCSSNSAAAEMQRAAVEAREVFRNVTYRIESASSGARYFGFSGQPVFDQRRRFKGYRGIAVDVTVQMRAERLTQLEHTVSRILAEADDVKIGIGAVDRGDVRVRAMDGRQLLDGGRDGSFASSRRVEPRGQGPAVRSRGGRRAAELAQLGSRLDRGRRSDARQPAGCERAGDAGTPAS